MRRVLISALAISLLGSPLQAAPRDISGDQVELGVFAGARLSVPLGHGAAKRTTRAALAISPTQVRLSPNGFTRTRIGEGLALEFDRSRPYLMLGGQRADVGLGLRPVTINGGDRSKSQLSTGAAIGIGIGVLAVAAAVAAVVYLSQDCNRLNENECSE